MLVGLTYDLREDYLKLGYHEEDIAEFDSPRTVEAIEEALQVLGFETERIGHLRSLIRRLTEGRRWDLVFNIAEGLGLFGREAQVPALLEAYNIPYTFSDPLTLTLTLHKGMAKRVVRDLGIPTPDFAVIESESDAELLDLPFPLFAKPVAEGTGKGVTSSSILKGKAALNSVCKRMLAKYGQPVLVESYLPGREFTVGILGTGSQAAPVGVMEVVLLKDAERGVYSYLNKEHCEKYVQYRLVEDAQAQEAAEVALKAWQGLGCRDAGRVDLRVDAGGRPNFMEVNPLAGLHPEHSDLPILCGMVGLTYLALIENIMRSALGRLPTRPQMPITAGTTEAGLKVAVG